MQTQVKQISLIKKHPHVYAVKLSLDFQDRYIGFLDTAQDGSFLCNRNSKHLFRKTSSLGMCYDFLKDSSIKFKYIVITYEGKTYRTTREHWLKHGRIFQFKNKNFEVQAFLPLSQINMNEAEDENDLFSSVA